MASERDAILWLDTFSRIVFVIWITYLILRLRGDIGNDKDIFITPQWLLLHLVTRSDWLEENVLVIAIYSHEWSCLSWFMEEIFMLCRYNHTNKWDFNYRSCIITAQKIWWIITMKNRTESLQQCFVFNFYTFPSIVLVYDRTKLINRTTSLIMFLLITLIYIWYDSVSHWTDHIDMLF